MRVARTGAGWALLASVGAAYLVTALALAVLAPLLEWVINLDQALNHMTFPPPPTGIGMAATWGLSVGVGAFVAIAVARAANGALAAALYSALVVVMAGIVVARAIIAQRDAIDSFTIVSVGNVPWAAAVTLLPAAVALIAGWVAGDRLRPAARRSNAALECAGAYALVAVAVSIVGGFPDLLTGPYFVAGFDAPLHGATVLAQALAAGTVYAIRAPRPFSVGAAVLFAVIGAAAALPTDVMPILFSLFLDWTYVPLSLALVPLATALIGLAIAAARGVTLRRAGRAMSG